MKKYLFGTQLLLLVFLLGSCQKAKEQKHDPIIKTEKVVSLSASKAKEFSFIAQPFRTSELSFRVGGPIARFDVYTGTRYKCGSTIAEIDPRDFKIRKERAEAIYRQSKAEYERIQKLYDKNNISQSTYEKAKAEYTSTKTEYETAINELADTRLIAPFDGYVSDIYIEKYQDVKPTQPVITFIDIDQLKIEIYVTQDIAYAAQSMKSMQIHFDSDPEKIYKAQVIEISKGTTRNNLSYLLTALLPNRDGKLLAGMSGKAILSPSSGKTADKAPSMLSIPLSALCHRPSTGDFIWVVDTHTLQVAQRKVTVGEMLPDGRVTITQGLKENETIAISGLRFLSDKMKINISNQND